MRATMFCSGLWFVAALSFPGCGSSDNAKILQESAEISDADAKQKAVAFVPGTASAVEKIETTDEHRWAVTIGTTGGGDAVVELERAGGRLDEISSDKGPFEYDLPAAAPGLATFATARAAVLAAKPGQLESWELNLVNNYWELYVRAADNLLWEVKADTKTTAIISTTQKAQRD